MLSVNFQKTILATTFVCLSAIYYTLNGQPQNNYINDAIMPAPNAASLGKYGDIPVNYATGIPSIGVPIYTIQEGPLSLPISLGYHASGLKVGEAASWVGAGWSLNAGGMVTRTILGLRDEGTGGYYYNGDDITEVTFEVAQSIANGQLDGEPDIFSFSFNGYSGKFVIDSAHQIHLIPKQDLQVEYEFNASADAFQRFSVTTPDGTQYHFGNTPGQSTNLGVEESSMSQPGGPGGPNPYNSTWNLVQVISADNNWEINFEYVDDTYSITSLASCYDITTYCELVGYGTSSSQTIGCNGELDNDVGKYINTISIKGKRLTKITTSSGTQTIDFIANNEREDLSYSVHFGTNNKAKRLDEVHVSSGTFCYKWIFSYEYFQDLDHATRSEYKRLKLTQVQQKACGNDPLFDIPPYVFSYEGPPNGNGTPFFPNRLSKAIDHWGYYNGADENNNNQVNIPPTNLGGVMKGESDRESNGSYAIYGVLSQIQYPTGGASLFTFESNTFDTIEQRIDSIVWNLTNCTTLDKYVCCDTLPYVVSETASFANQLQIDSGKCLLKLDAVDPASPGDCYQEGFEIFARVNIRVEKIVSGGPNEFIGANGFNFNPQNILKDSISFPLEDLGTFQVGPEYLFILKVENGRGQFDLLSGPFTEQVNKEIGGLRVQKIQHRPMASPSSNDIKLTYDYSKEGEPEKSSGLLFNTPFYGYYHVDPGGGYYFLTYKDACIAPLGNFEGYHMGYTRVIENHNGNGRKVFEFNVENVPYEYIIPTPPALLAVENGTLKEASIEDEGGTSKKKTTNTPVYTNYSLVPGVILKVETLPLISCGTETPLTIILYAAYNPRTAAYRIDQTEETLDGVLKTTSFSYSSDPDHPLLPIETSFTNSDGKVIKTKTKYSYNQGEVCLQNELRDRYMISAPISTKVYVDDVLVNGDSLKFDIFDPVTGLPNVSCDPLNPDAVYPWKIYKYEVDLEAPIGTGQWVEKAEYEEWYMNYGLPKSFSIKPKASPTQEGWASEVYEWETNGLIKKKTYENFEWEYTYYANTRLLSSITDIDNQIVEYAYDPLMRLDTTKARDDKVIATYSYKYGAPQEWQSGNNVQTNLFFDGDPDEEFEDQRTIQHFDGLGRPLDTWKINYGPQFQNIVAEKIFYDKYGRVEKGSYTPDIKQGLDYTEYLYEESPLNRAIRETYPDGYSVKIAYGNEGNYYTLTSTDENDHSTVTLTDILGRKTKVEDALNNSTIFEYDNKNNLKKVTNPENQDYLYSYDARNRLIKKSVPGAHCQDFYYDERDLLIASRDGNMFYGDDPTPQNKWLVNRYDIYGRPTIMGLGGERSTPLVSFAPCGGTISASLNLEIADTLIMNTYDVQGQTECVSTYTPVGKLSTTAARVLNPDGTFGSMLWSKLCYDDYGRIDNTESDQFALSGKDVVSMSYDLADHPLKTIRQYNLQSGSPEISIMDVMDVDHGGRSKSHYQDIESSSASSTDVGISRMYYNTRDQLVKQEMENLAGMTYGYNDRGWLTHINQMPFADTDPLAGCSLPVPPPYDDSEMCGECGDDLVNLEYILSYRFNRMLNINCYIPCDCDNRCTPSLVVPCLDTTVYLDSELTTPISGLEYPTWIYEIRKCTDEQDYVLEEDLPGIPEVYTVEGRIMVESGDQYFRVETTAGDTIITLSELLDQMGSGGDIDIKTGQQDLCLDCITTPPSCSPTEAADQLLSLDDIENNLIVDASNLTFPTNLIRVRLCSGLEIYLFEEEIADLNGSFIILQIINITNQFQILSIGADGQESHLALTGFLSLRDLEAGWVINYYRSCEDNECGVVGERHMARSIGASTVFSDYDSEDPYSDLTVEYPQADNSLEYDFLNLWYTNGISPDGEAEWDVSVAVSPDATLKSYSAHVIIPDLRVYSARFALYDGNGIIPVNGGLNYVTVTGMTFPFKPDLILTPDQLPTLDQVYNMKLAIFVGSGTIDIDAVFVEIDYIEPCDRCQEDDPVCTAEEKALQQTSLNTIKTAAQTTSISEIPIPTNLYRVRLCDGSEVYLLHHELLLLEGDHLILQKIVIESLGQLFATKIGDRVPEDPAPTSPPARFDLFALKLQYYHNDMKIHSSLNQGYANGNIATMYWQVAKRDRQAYGFEYDALDRLEQARYANIAQQSRYYGHGLYDAWDFAYDKIGNILSLKRNGGYGDCEQYNPYLYEYGMIDNLSYTYNTEKTHLQSVTDGVTGDPALAGFGVPQSDYDYDNNGNLISDSGKEMDFYYNHLNLPRLISTTLLNPGSDEIELTYDATGRKLQKESTQGVSVLYHDGIERHKVSSNDEDIFVHNENGRAAFYADDPNGGPNQPERWLYEYTFHDHLGNTRLTVADLNEDGYIQVTDQDWSGGVTLPSGYTELLQEGHYYPFGMSMNGPWNEPSAPQKENKYLYNGKEFNEDLGLDWSDYGARWYDAAIGRWNTVDPLADQYAAWGPYSYTFGNPIRFIDPDGMAPDDFVLINSEGTEVGRIPFAGEDILINIESLPTVEVTASRDNEDQRGGKEVLTGTDRHSGRGGEDPEGTADAIVDGIPTPAGGGASDPFGLPNMFQTFGKFLDHIFSQKSTTGEQNNNTESEPTPEDPPIYVLPKYAPPIDPNHTKPKHGATIHVPELKILDGGKGDTLIGIRVIQFDTTGRTSKSHTGAWKKSERLK